MPAVRARFQESAIPGSTGALPASARLFSWGARALYLGPALNLTPHRNAVAVLALGLDAPFGVSEDAGDPAARYRPCRSVLVLPGTLHHFRDTEGRMAFLYVDPVSRDLARLKERAAAMTARAGFDLDIEARLIGLFDDLAAGRSDWTAARAALAPLLGTAAPADARIAKGLALLHQDFGARVPLADLARAAGLSEGRFRHLFVAATGVPVRRYRLWIAMGGAMRSIGRGESLTTAAHAAGFSSSAHFSASFRGMFGMEPSRLAGGRLAHAGSS